MGYTPFTLDYSADLAGQARIYARQAQKRSNVAQIFANGNAVMGGLTTECCSDPAFGGQDYYDPAGLSVSAAMASLVSGTPAPSAPASSQAGASQPSGPSFPLTPVDILTHSGGWQMQPNGKPWPRARLPRSAQRAIANAYPNYGPTLGLRSLVPPCPCFSTAQPVLITVPRIAPAPAAAPAAAPCPYPGCSTGNVCLDLITGCVSNSQVDPAQTQACALANYPIFGNSGAWLSPILLGCGTKLPYLGTPLPNPPTADPSMYPALKAAITAGGIATGKARGTAGLGQVDSTGPSNVGGFLAILGLFGIVVWAARK